MPRRSSPTRLDRLRKRVEILEAEVRDLRRDGTRRLMAKSEVWRLALETMDPPTIASVVYESAGIPPVDALEMAKLHVAHFQREAEDQAASLRCAAARAGSWRAVRTEEVACPTLWQRIRAKVWP